MFCKICNNQTGFCDACKPHSPCATKTMPMIIKEQADEIAILKKQLEDWKASQHYRYIGKNNIPIKARDLEDSRDEYKQQLDNLILLVIKKSGMYDTLGKSPLEHAIDIIKGEKV